MGFRFLCFGFCVLGGPGVGPRVESHGIPGWGPPWDPRGARGPGPVGPMGPWAHWPQGPGPQGPRPHGPGAHGPRLCITLTIASTCGLARRGKSARGGGEPHFIFYFFLSIPISNLQSRQKKIKSRSRDFGRGGDPHPMISGS